MTRDDATQTSDPEIVALLQDAGEDGLRQLLQVHGPRVNWLLKDRFGDVLAEPDLAAALNEAAYRAFRAIRTFDPAKGTLRGWFWRIAANAAHNLLRAESRHAHLDLTYDPYDQPRPPGSLEEDERPASSEALQDLQEAIEALPDLQRKVIRADLASGDVAGAAWLARKYATTEGSIYMARSRARENLRKALAGRKAFEDRKVMP